jgi:hypothetical protein
MAYTFTHLGTDWHIFGVVVLWTLHLRIRFPAALARVLRNGGLQMRANVSIGRN